MTNTKLFLLIGTSLSLIPTLTFAQCVATQDCAALGYTETSCSGGSGVKCPFGNKWACFKSESEICNDLGFTQTCTGTGYSGGGSKVCNGKYNYCACSDGYTWNDSSQQCENTCVIGALYYSGGTCSDKLESSKTLLGVVIYEKSASQNGWIMAVKPVATGIAWGGYETDIPGLTNITSSSNLTDTQASCTNTDIITVYASSSKYPAAWAAKNYSPACTPGDKSWCLPSGGLLNNINNSTNFAKVNAGITTARGTILGNVYNGYERVWSSSESGSGYAWYFAARTSGSFGMNYGSSKFGTYSYDSVRPVMPF